MRRAIYLHYLLGHGVQLNHKGHPPPRKQARKLKRLLEDLRGREAMRERE